MFQQKSAMFLYAQSPVHMGTGVAVGGLVDNPIQRETHTDYPYFAASGLKGAIRHHLTTEWSGGNMEGFINRIFGPDTSSSDYAGALSFSDASLVLFPVQSIKNSFVYISCPTVLARTQRALAISGVTTDWEIGDIGKNQALTVNEDLMVNDKIMLETYDYEAKISSWLKPIADWLGQNTLPESVSNQFFSKKISNDLVVIPDEDFRFFVQNATSVEPHVKIDDKTGTAQDGALFYTENLPPESILISTVMTSVERQKKSSGEVPFNAAIILDHVTKALNGKTVQIGGDSTTGRGLVSLNFTGAIV